MTAIAAPLLILPLLAYLMSPVQDQSAQRPEAKHLIESIRGETLYLAYCAVCHGKDGKGGGPMAASLKAKMPDLTHITARNKGKYPLERVQKVISGQEPMASGHGPREMPVWGPIFSQIAWDQDLGQIRTYNLAKYIEQMQAK